MSTRPSKSVHHTLDLHRHRRVGVWRRECDVKAGSVVCFFFLVFNLRAGDHPVTFRPLAIEREAIRDERAASKFIVGPVVNHRPMSTLTVPFGFGFRCG
jgi:hypothetical protein